MPSGSPTSTPTPAWGSSSRSSRRLSSGGVAVTGGRGNLIGSLLGVALLGSIAPALVFLGTNPYLAFLGSKPQWEKAIQGLIILLAVASDSLNREAR